MEMEMGMRVLEDIDIGEDVTQAMGPLCWVKAPPHSTSSIVGAAVALLRRPEASSSDGHFRIAGLLTNHRMLMSDSHLSSTIRDAARAVATAIATLDNHTVHESELELKSTAAVCAVLTNSVEVQDRTGCNVAGIAVYGPAFSWINHSCSPNGFYHASTSHHDRPTVTARIAPFKLQGESPVSVYVTPKGIEENEDGPRIRVRSIKRISNGDQLNVAYTDLLQPKGLRQSELWSKYRFICRCSRCSAEPLTYVDYVLEGIFIDSLSSFSKDEATKALTDYIDDAISDYLSDGDPQSCCEKLERVLTRGLPDDKDPASGLTYWLHPLNCLSLNAYTALASAYKTRAHDMLALASETKLDIREAFDMSRVSVAYSLLLAGSTNHLFRLEPSLIASSANYWVTVGESLVNFARNSAWWNEFMPGASLSFVKNYQCRRCSLQDQSGVEVIRYADFENISGEFLHCVTHYSQTVWCLLVRGVCHLRVFKNPFDFSWLDGTQYSSLWRTDKESGDNGTDKCISNLERIHLFQLGIHCLIYGKYLAGICFGENSYLESQAHAILNCEEEFINHHDEQNRR